jgi:hypothetical protein
MPPARAAPEKGSAEESLKDLSGGAKEERLRLVSRRYEQARCGGGQPLRPTLVSGLFFKIEGKALAAVKMDLFTRP